MHLDRELVHHLLKKLLLLEGRRHNRDLFRFDALPCKVVHDRMNDGCLIVVLVLHQIDLPLKGHRKQLVDVHQGHHSSRLLELPQPRVDRLHRIVHLKVEHLTYVLLTHSDQTFVRDRIHQIGNVVVHRHSIPQHDHLVRPVLTQPPEQRDRDTRGVRLR